MRLLKDKKTIQNRDSFRAAGADRRGRGAGDVPIAAVQRAMDRALADCRHAHEPAKRTPRPKARDSEQEASRWVRSMFGRVAHRYDFANHLLSANIDRYWRNRAVARVRDILKRPGARVLDLACGTGDLLIALERAGGRARLDGSDFCHPMLTGAQTSWRAGDLRSTLMESDALALPFPDASARPDHDRVRLPKSGELPGGTSGDAARAAAGRSAGDPRIHAAAERGFRGASTTGIRGNVLPVIGGAISGAPEAYKYLPESVRKFPGAPELAGMMTRERVRSGRVGISDVRDCGAACGAGGRLNALVSARGCGNARIPFACGTPENPLRRAYYFSYDTILLLNRGGSHEDI